MATTHAALQAIPARGATRISRVGWLLRGLLTLAMIGQLLGLPGAVALAAPPVASIVVTTLGDTFDAGDCATVVLGDLPGPDNEVTLREAVCASNNTAGDETIVFGGITGTISPATELLITGGLTILGAGLANMTISGGNSHRVFSINGGGTVTISDLTIADGATDEGGGLYTRDSAVTLQNVIVRNNQASGRGGGVYLYNGTLNLQTVAVLENSAFYSGGIHTYSGSLGMTGGNIERNSATANGGIGNSTATITLTDVYVGGNSATVADGGGITTQGPLTLNGTTVTNNSSAHNNGGGLYIVDGPAPYTVSLIGSTVRGNTAYGRGGGIGVYGRAEGHAVTLAVTASSVISDNTAGGSGGGIDNHSEGGQVAVGLADSLLSGNHAGYGGGIANTENLVKPTAGAAANGALATVRLERTSLQANTTEAIGIGGGIYNATAPYAPLPLATPVAASLSLESSSVGNNSAHDGAGIFNDSGTVALISSEVRDNTATQEGGGIYTNDYLYLEASRVLGNRALVGAGVSARYATVAVIASSISNNLAQPIALGSGPASISEPLGGGIHSLGGAITLTDTTVQANQALYWPGFGQPRYGDGGGIHASGGSVGVHRSTVANNWANNGAGIYSAGGNALDVLNSTISGNHAYANGGGIYSRDSQASLDFATVVLNDADYDGDYDGGLGYGLYLEHLARLTATDGPAQGPVFTIARSIVAGNKYTGIGYEDCHATGAAYASDGNNLFGDSLYGQDCPVGPTDLTLASETEIYTVVGGLADNGGATKTHALKADGVAIDAFACPETGLEDQRGVGRPQGPGCDIGAFELETAPPSPSPSPTVALTVQVTGAGTVQVSPLPPLEGLVAQSGQVYQYPAGTVVTLTAFPDTGNLLARWIVDGTTQPPYGNGWANPLTVTLDVGHTVAATFAARPAFSDVPGGTTGYQVATELAARGIAKGYSQEGCAARGLASPCYGPTESTERAQAAAFLARLLGVDGEDHGTGGFTDFDGLAPELQRAVGTLAFYGVMRGYGGGKFGPFDKITHAETAMVISRAMVLKGYWARATQDDPAIYPNIDLGPDGRLDLVTFVRNAGTLPGFANDTPRWPLDLPAVRIWTAQALWQALNGYFGVDQPGKGGYVP